MQHNHESLIVANWKMNPQTLAEAVALLRTQKQHLRKYPVVIAPPALYLHEARKVLKGTTLLLGSQDVSAEKMGARTGELSATMLKDSGVTHVIVGHSERRTQGETDALIEKKVALALKSDLTTILCVGERERDTHGKYFTTVEEQVRLAVRGVPASKLIHLAIAYEPVWAISTATPHAHPATPEDAHEMILFIRKVLTDLFGRSAAARVRILYGGSVTDKNIEMLAQRSGAQGYLVGGSSLRPQEFTTIVRTIYG